jgi:hypothetical protein
MAEPLDFETALAARLQARAGIASRPFDAAAIASAAIATRPARRVVIRWPAGSMRWVVLAVAALLAALGVALLAGAILRNASQGPWLAIARPDGVHLAHPDGAEPRLIFASGGDVDLAWSADGAYLMVMEHPVRGMAPPSARVTVLRTDGSIVWAGMVSEMPAWSSHDHRLAYVGDGVLIVTDVDSGITTTLDGWRFARGSVDWSPDDSRIAATGFSDRHSTTVVVVTLAGGQVVDLTPASTSEVSHPDWSPNGRYISAWWCGAVSDECGGNTSIVIDATTGVQVDGLSDVGWYSRWSPGGSRLAWVVPGSWIHVARMPASGGDLRLDAGRLDASGVDGDGLVGWTGDGRSLLVLRANGATVLDARPWSDQITYVPSPRAVTDLWRVGVDGSAPTLLAANVSTAAMQPDVSPPAPSALP